jgi:hypothetical protein
VNSSAQEGHEFLNHNAIALGVFLGPEKLPSNFMFATMWGAIASKELIQTSSN